MEHIVCCINSTRGQRTPVNIKLIKWDSSTVLVQTDPLYGHIHGWPAVDIYCVHRIRLNKKYWMRKGHDTNTICRLLLQLLYSREHWADRGHHTRGKTICVYEPLRRRASPARVFAHTAVFVCRQLIHNSTTDAVCALETSPKTKQTKNKTTKNLFGCVCQHQRCDLHARCVGCNLQRRRQFSTENRHRSFAHKVKRKLAATEHWIMVFFCCCLVSSNLLLFLAVSHQSVLYSCDALLRETKSKPQNYNLWWLRSIEIITFIHSNAEFVRRQEVICIGLESSQ